MTGIEIHTLSFHRGIASNDALSTVEKTQTQAWAPVTNELQIIVRQYWTMPIQNESEYIKNASFLQLVFCPNDTRCYLIRNLAQGLVLTVPYFWASFYHIVVLKIPYKFLNFNCTFSAVK